MTTYFYRYLTLTNYWAARNDDNFITSISNDDPGLLEWISKGNTPEKEVVNDLVFLKIVDNNVVLDYSKAVNELQRLTESHIDLYMPQWRLNRWRRYYDLSEKIKGGGTLNSIEQAEYDSFPDTGETHEICQTYVPLALQWCIDCIAAHKNALINVASSTTLEELESSIIITYPPWIA